MHEQHTRRLTIWTPKNAPLKPPPSCHPCHRSPQSFGVLGLRVPYLDGLGMGVLLNCGVSRSMPASQLDDDLNEFYGRISSPEAVEVGYHALAFAVVDDHALGHQAHVVKQLVRLTPYHSSCCRCRHRVRDVMPPQAAGSRKRRSYRQFIRRMHGRKYRLRQESLVGNRCCWTIHAVHGRCARLFRHSGQ